MPVSGHCRRLTGALARYAPPLMEGNRATISAARDCQVFHRLQAGRTTAQYRGKNRKSQRLIWRFVPESAGANWYESRLQIVAGSTIETGFSRGREPRFIASDLQ